MKLNCGELCWMAKARQYAILCSSFCRCCIFLWSRGKQMSTKVHCLLCTILNSISLDFPVVHDILLIVFDKLSRIQFLPHLCWQIFARWLQYSYIWIWVWRRFRWRRCDMYYILLVFIDVTFRPDWTNDQAFVPIVNSWTITTASCVVYDNQT